MHIEGRIKLLIHATRELVVVVVVVVVLIAVTTILMLLCKALCFNKHHVMRGVAT
jgi:hypothetical protein